MARGATTFDSSMLKKRAVIFSPHFDDETLGCGGTIARKRRAGTPVQIVFMTDGAKSHEGWLEPERLSRLRAAEGLAAAAALGVEERDVHMLGFEETKLSAAYDTAVDRTRKILEDFSPEEVYVPHPLEPPEDHAVTHDIVVDALRGLGLTVTVYAYPIWIWDFWPWKAP